jgi:hypothetical protein
MSAIRGQTCVYREQSPSSHSDHTLLISSNSISAAPLLRNSRAEDLCPEESTFGLLNHLLIHALRGMIHHNRACLVVDFRINLGVSDQVDNPLLAF